MNTAESPRHSTSAGQEQCAHRSTARIQSLVHKKRCQSRGTRDVKGGTQHATRGIGGNVWCGDGWGARLDIVLHFTILHVMLAVRLAICLHIWRTSRNVHITSARLGHITHNPPHPSKRIAAVVMHAALRSRLSARLVSALTVRCDCVPAPCAESRPLLRCLLSAVFAGPCPLVAPIRRYARLPASPACSTSCSKLHVL